MSLTNKIINAVKSIYKRLKINNELYYFDSFNDWDEALHASRSFGDAYESENIIKQVINATETVRRGEAVYEQDGVLYYEDDHIYEFLAALFYVLTEEDKVNICDFGGALGSTYFRYRKILPVERISWNIVEQKSFVDYGKENINEIGYFYTVDEMIRDCGKIDAVLLLSVLPYLEEPLAILADIFKHKPKYIIIDETVFNVSDDEDEHIVLQHVPSSIYKAVYPSRIFNRASFINIFEGNGYKKVFEWVYPGGAIPTKKRFTVKDNIDRGFLFELNE